MQFVMGVIRAVFHKLQQFKIYFLVNFVWLLVCAEYLDGVNAKEQIYNQVYEDIQNNFLNRL